MIDARGTSVGTALIEMLVALILLAVGLVALLATSPALTAQARAGHLSSVLALEAQSTLEEMMASPLVESIARSDDRQRHRSVTGERIERRGGVVELRVIVHMELGLAKAADTLSTLVIP